MRLNCLHPPFDDVRLRQAVRPSVIQENYMQAAQGDDRSTWTTTPQPLAEGHALLRATTPT